MPWKVLFISDISISPATTLAERMLIKGLHDKGVDIAVVTHFATPGTIELEAAGIVVHYIPITKKISKKAVASIRKILMDGSFDLLHLTFGKAVTNALRASRGMDIKVVAYFGSLSIHWHDPFAYLGFLNKRIDRLICLSDSVEEHVKRQLPRNRRNRTVRIYRGFDPGWLSELEPVTRESLGIPADAFVVGCVAIVRRVKGVPYLIKAAGLLPDNLPVWFLLVGDDTDSPAIQQQVARSKYSSQFVLTGRVPVAPAYTAICDLYVQPSITEGLGRAVLEAMSLKKPVVVTDGGGAKELFAGGENGFVVPAKSAQAIADSILWCYNNQSQLRETGEKARMRLINDFRPETTVEKTIDVYHDLIPVRQ
jgi:glycosyltransferase involved in cell wall biosynthesis